MEDCDGWISGEELAEALGISRAAVAKHVDALRKAGHVIQARTHKGYRLEVKAERIDRDRIAAGLRTRLFGRTGWRILDSTTSTNTEAITWALSGGPEGAVITAERQTDGKGRKGHDWFSSPRGLHFSIILPPDGRTIRARRVTDAALAAVAEALSEFSPVRPRIKKPNDLLLNGKKICGVLVESGMRGGDPDWLVLGIGCNVNVPAGEFPEGIRDKVTSLYLESGQTVSKNGLLASILNRLEPLLRAET